MLRHYISCILVLYEITPTDLCCVRLVWRSVLPVCFEWNMGTTRCYTCTVKFTKILASFYGIVFWHQVYTSTTYFFGDRHLKWMLLRLRWCCSGYADAAVIMLLCKWCCGYADAVVAARLCWCCCSCFDAVAAMQLKLHNYVWACLLWYVYAVLLNMRECT